MVLAALVVSFATFVTAHFWICGRLVAGARPRWLGLVAFFVPPLAPVYGFRTGSRFPVVLWLVAVLAYAAALIAASL